MKHILLTLLFAPLIGFGQNILYLGGKAHLGNGEFIDVSAISVNNGKFEMVANAKTIRINPQAFDTIIHIYDHHVYPAFIATNTTLGITEISAVRATNDYRETGTFKPHVRSLIAYNAESVIIPTIRSNGVLLAQIAPQGGRITGSSSVMKLDGWNWEDAVLKADDGIHLNWPPYFVQTGWWAEPGDIKKTEEYDMQCQEMEDYFVKSKSFYESKSTVNDLPMMAMQGLFSGEKRLYIHANLQREMTDAILFAKKMGVKHMAIVGAREAHKMAAFLKENNIPVILDRIHRLPATESTGVDVPYKQASILHKAGVKFAFCYQGDMEAMGQRNLPFSAGTAVAHGLPYEEAVKALTLNTAEILGIDEHTGQIKAGMDATFFISKGDALDMMGNEVKHAFIKGQAIDLDNKQKVLNRKYRKKYGLEVN
ncbi:MAG: amidohydrolase family protein [Flavobacteriales bacterium]